MERAFKRMVDDRVRHVEQLGRVLDSVSYRRVLERGCFGAQVGVGCVRQRHLRRDRRARR